MTNRRSKRYHWNKSITDELSLLAFHQFTRVMKVARFVVTMAVLTTASALAAKKANKISGSASTVKGFGKAPLTFAETLATFRTRVPDSAEEQSCPCGLYGKSYGECCSLYHKGKLTPQSPLAVLQSRYSAFCWRMIGYVIESTHPTCRDYQEDKIAWAKDLDKRSMFDSFDFVGLKVLNVGDVSPDDDVGFVEFQVQMRAKEQTGSRIQGQMTTIQERSTFLRDKSNGTWSYASGDVRSTVEGIDDVTLNPLS
jgi:SEC-C motif domain protein